MKKEIIGLGLAAVLMAGPVLPQGVKAESLFKDLMKATGSVYKFTGETMDNLSKGREDSLIGKGLKVGGKVHNAVGSALEETAAESPEKKNSKIK